MSVSLDGLLHVDFRVVDRLFRVCGDPIENLRRWRRGRIADGIGGVRGQAGAQGPFGQRPDQTIRVDGGRCVRGRVERPICTSRHHVSTRATNKLGEVVEDVILQHPQEDTEVPLRADILNVAVIVQVLDHPQPQLYVWNECDP